MRHCLKMNKNLTEAIRFSDEISQNKEILQIILFGSVARGEDKNSSDIDIGVVHNSKDKLALMQNVNKSKPNKIQVTFVHIKDLAKETELVGALSGDGILLYGQPIIIQEKSLELKARVLIAYSLTKLPQTEKVKVNRALYGSTSRSSYGDKKYISKAKGLTNEPGIERISKSVLLVERRKSPKIIGMLKRFGAEVKETPLWTY